MRAEKISYPVWIPMMEKKKTITKKMKMLKTKKIPDLARKDRQTNGSLY